MGVQKKAIFLSSSDTTKSENFEMKLSGFDRVQCDTT
jgi:hypothetical protein